MRMLADAMMLTEHERTAFYDASHGLVAPAAPAQRASS
jgi:hypothetical protein